MITDYVTSQLMLRVVAHTDRIAARPASRPAVQVINLTVFATLRCCCGAGDHQRGQLLRNYT